MHATATPILTDIRTDLVTLVGYPGKSESRRLRRIHEQPHSATFVEIKIADIVDESPKGHGLEPGQVVIHVRGDAQIHAVELPVRFLGRPGWPRR